jgi:hypothetical protein
MVGAQYSALFIRLELVSEQLREAPPPFSARVSLTGTIELPASNRKSPSRSVRLGQWAWLVRDVREYHNPDTQRCAGFCRLRVFHLHGEAVGVR